MVCYSKMPIYPCLMFKLWKDLLAEPVEEVESVCIICNSLGKVHELSFCCLKVHSATTFIIKQVLLLLNSLLV